MVSQHKKGIVQDWAYEKCLELSFNAEFQNMLLVCVFVPFLSEETPKPHNVAKTKSQKGTEQELRGKIQRVLDFRQQLVNRLSD